MTSTLKRKNSFDGSSTHLSKSSRSNNWKLDDYFSCDFIVASNNDGCRRYLKLQSADEMSNFEKEVLTEEEHLLFPNIRELIFDIENETRLNNEEHDVGMFRQQCSYRAQQNLWVEKYAPATYRELISEEDLNRTLLSWLKCWDGLVFGRSAESRVASMGGSRRAAKKERQQLKKKSQIEELYTEELDEYKRPKNKVALLCGPPGLGKTTLAHIVARHAGYNTVEFNASDDRSGKAFLEKLADVSGHRADVFGQSKPNCVIIDEIDGASSAAVEILFKFLKSDCLTVELVKRMNVAEKDAQNSLFTVWKDVFTPPRLPEKKFSSFHDLQDFAEATGVLPGALNEDLSEAEHLAKLLRAASSVDASLLEQGLHENLFDMKYKDSRLSKTRCGLDWLCFTNELQRRIVQEQQFLLTSFTSFYVAAFHLLFASKPNRAIKMQFPSVEIQHDRQMKQNIDMVTAMVSAMQPNDLQHFDAILPGQSASSLTVILPVLLELVLSPSLKPTNIQLLSERERTAVRQLVALMRRYGLTYRQERSADGVFVFVLDPNLEELVHFPGIKHDVGLPYATRQLISREIDMDKIRHESSAEAVAAKAATSKLEDLSTEVSAESATVPRHLQQLQPKRVDYVDAVARDFFGRVIEPETACPPLEMDHSQSTSRLFGEIWFHYKEGCTSAVRRSVKMSSIWKMVTE